LLFATGTARAKRMEEAEIRAGVAECMAMVV
jgi:hypothetical protein